MNNLKLLVENKKVAIIGPSPSILEKKNGKLIDSYDIVIRIKKGFPVQEYLKKNLGSKTDILCSHLKLPQNNLEFCDLIKLHKSNCKMIYMPYPITIAPFDKFYTNFINHYNKFLTSFKISNSIEISYNYNNYDYFQLCEEMDTTPTTGIAMIIELLKHNFKELFITGFTFRLDGYYSDYKTKEEDKESYIRTFINRQIHNTANEAKYLKPLLLNKDNIVLDDKLYEILKNIY